MMRKRQGISGSLPATAVALGTLMLIVFGFIFIKQLAQGSKFDSSPPHSVITASSTPVQLVNGHLSVDGNALVGADPNTFVILDDTYGEDATHVYTIVGGEEPYVGEVKGADRASFTVLGGNNGYAKDARHAYWAGIEISGADVRTFTNLGYLYAKDAKHLYWKGYPLSDLGVDVNTVQVLPGGEYIKDANHVYIHTSDADGVVAGADPNSFVVLTTSDDASWAKDAHHIYYYGKIVAGADPSTFVVLNSVYGKDTEHVYYLGMTIQIADPSTFVVLSGWFAKDAHHVFASDKPIAGADVSSFVVMPDGNHFTPAGNWYIARDKNHYYDYNKVVQ